MPENIKRGKAKDKAKDKTTSSSAASATWTYADEVILVHTLNVTGSTTASLD